MVPRSSAPPTGPISARFPMSADDGTAYCSISPRFRWHEEWTGRRCAPRSPHAAGGRRRRRGVESARSATCGSPQHRVRAGRAADGRARRADVSTSTGRCVRQVLRPASGELLRSNTFTLTATGAGRRVTRLVADGAGAGHGVGFCQWGAVGRSRGGAGLPAHPRGLLSRVPRSSASTRRRNGA